MLPPRPSPVPYRNGSATAALLVSMLAALLAVAPALADATMPGPGIAVYLLAVVLSAAGATLAIAGVTAALVNRGVGAVHAIGAVVVTGAVWFYLLVTAVS